MYSPQDRLISVTNIAQSNRAWTLAIRLGPYLEFPSLCMRDSLNVPFDEEVEGRGSIVIAWRE